MKPIFFPVLDNGSGSIRACFFDSVAGGAFARQPVHLVRLGDSHPGRARNRAAADFLLTTSCDYMLFVDADIRFTAQHIAWLMESDEPLLCGVYFKKMPGIHPCLCSFPGQTMLERDQYTKVARSGTGFMRIHRKVFEALKPANGGPADFYTNHGREEWDFFKSGVRDREWLSEDWFFCDMARGAGFDCVIDGRIQVLHEGSVMYPILPTGETVSEQTEQTPISASAGDSAQPIIAPEVVQESCEQETPFARDMREDIARRIQGAAVELAA